MDWFSVWRLSNSLLPRSFSGEEEKDVNVLILSYPQYCRYRSMRKRIQGKPSSVQADQFVLALGGVAAISQRSQILYCRDTFDHPTLVENESVCDEFGKSLHLSFCLRLKGFSGSAPHFASAI